MPAVWDGKELKQISVADFNARNMPSANTGGGSSSSMLSPVTGAPAQAQKTSGGGIKGGRDPIDPSKVESSQYNTDKNYGYYNDQGKYVSAWQDRIDGGGRNQSGNYFVGGGLFSSLLNALKIRPSGAARERDDQGNYVVDRADIGYRDFKDMYDRGGPQASGGRFEGLGLYSDFANLLFGEQGQRTPYAAQTRQPAMAAPVSGGSQPAGLLRPRPRPLSVSETAAMEDAYPAPEFVYDYPSYTNQQSQTSQPQYNVNQYSIPSKLSMRQAEPSYSQAATGDVGSIFQTPDYQQYVNAVREMEKGMGLLPFTEDQMRMAYAKKGRY